MSENNKCENCKFRGFDMDGFYCASPKAMQVSPVFGLSLQAMSRGYCKPPEKPLFVAK